MAFKRLKEDIAQDDCFQLSIGYYYRCHAAPAIFSQMHTAGYYATLRADSHCHNGHWWATLRCTAASQPLRSWSHSFIAFLSHDIGWWDRQLPASQAGWPASHKAFSHMSRCSQPATYKASCIADYSQASQRSQARPRQLLTFRMRYAFIIGWLIGLFLISHISRHNSYIAVISRHRIRLSLRHFRDIFSWCFHWLAINNATATLALSHYWLSLLATLAAIIDITSFLFGYEIGFVLIAFQ